MNIDELPEKIELMFSLDQLQGAGKGFVIALIALLGISYIPTVKTTTITVPNEPLFNINALEAKYNTAAFHIFMNELISRNQVLILGTSESVSLGGKNYHHFLNADTNLNTKFAVFSGAGRLADIYIPLMLASPEVWRDQKILLFVNPIYWRKGLNHPSEEYQNRYVTPSILSQINYEKINNPNASHWYQYKSIWKINQFIPLFSFLESRSEALQNLLQNKEVKISPVKTDASLSTLDPESLKNLVIDSLNVSPQFLKKNPKLKMHPATEKEGYQYQINQAFFEICNDLNIDLTVVYGPYNGVLGKALEQNEETLNYAQVHQSFLTLMKDHQSPIQTKYYICRIQTIWQSN